jgi:hypothetical protein
MGSGRGIEKRINAKSQRGVKKMRDYERDELVRDIGKAFKNVKHPKKLGNISEIQGLEGKQWKDLSVDDVKRNRNVYFFTDEGFKYFLPGYLMLMVRYPEQFSNSELLELLLRHLSQINTMVTPASLCKLFDQQQKAAILKFLDHVESLYLSPRDIGLSQIAAHNHGKVFKSMEKRRNELLELVKKAKMYWEGCR